MTHSPNNSLEYTHGLCEDHFETAAQLYEFAFGEKFAKAIPKKEDRLYLISKSIMPEYAFTAVDGNRLVGIAGYQTATGSLTGGMTSGKIISRLGLLAGVRACLILSFYERKSSSGELVMDGISVHPEYRRMGIGTQLLNRIASYASENGYTKVRLDVIDTNTDAIKLYKRFGFKVIKEEKYSFLKPFLGFGGSVIMEYRV